MSRREGLYRQISDIMNSNPAATGGVLCVAHIARRFRNAMDLTNKGQIRNNQRHREEEELGVVACRAPNTRQSKNFEAGQLKTCLSSEGSRLMLLNRRLRTRAFRARVVI